MDEKMDHGSILAQKIINIAPDSTYLELYNKLALEAQNLTNLTCLDWINGKITPQPQDDSLATFCQEFGRGDGQINWHKSAEEIYNQYRGMTPWPGVFTFLNSKRLKLITINVPDSINTNQNVGFASRPVGVIIVESGKIFVNCGDNNSIEILELQLEGKNKLNAAEFIKGQKNLRGIRLSS
jgi:methionyl-tRNA formyltransferase